MSATPYQATPVCQFTPADIVRIFGVPARLLTINDSPSLAAQLCARDGHLRAARWRGMSLRCFRCLRCGMEDPL